MEPDEIEFQIATGPLALAAVATRAEVFSRDFGHVGDDGVDGAGQHLVALVQGEVVAGFRLLGPELRPFAFEQNLDLSAMVRAGRRPALLGRLFVRQDWRPVGRSALLLPGLFGLSLRTAMSCQITDFYISSFAHLMTFYGRFGYRSLGVSIEDEHWQTLHLMHLDVEKAVANPRLTLDI